MEAISIFLAFAIYMNFKAYQIDVKSAFLNGKLKEEVYVKQPPGFKSSKFTDYICKLNKALYGLKQATKAWYKTLSTFLIQNKFITGRIDNTLFIYKSKGDVLLVQVYVDDIIFSSTSYKLCKHFEKLITRKFEISMMGELTYFLRLQIKQDDKEISIFQEQYTRNLLKKYEMFDSFLVKTPMVPPNNLGLDLTDNLMCKILVQSKGITSNYYEKNPQIPERKITSGACQILGGKLVCWSAKKQQLVAMSLAEAECVAAAREFFIKFSVLNWQRPLTLDLNTFCSSTGLDYNNGKYVAHPTPKVVKKELGKIAINSSYLDKTLVLKNSFPVAWRFLFTFVIQVLDRNYSSTKQVNSIQ
nr:retrovirus-related Pol polyprotein from transposon TNT 1-94 [Tanacetum cinerariifolium]